MVEVEKFLKNYSTRLFVFFLILLSFAHLVFAFRINSFFSVDDFAVLAYLKNNNLLTMIGEFLSKGDVFGFRKVIGFLFFGTVYSLFGTNAHAFVFTNFIFHTANLLLIFAVVRYLTKRDYVAFFVSIIFNKYYLFYFSNIHEYSATLFSLLSIYLFLSLPKKIYLSLISFILALLSKELAFSLPFFLLGICWVLGKDMRKVVPHFLILLIYAAYQSFFWASGMFVPENLSYTPSYSPESIVRGTFFYLDWKILVFLFVLPFLTKKYKTLTLFAVGIFTLLPALVFVNRRELYYLYLPGGYILIYLGLVFPRSFKKATLTFLVALFVFGGRTVFPKIARQEFTNVQKESIKKVVFEVEGSLNNRPEEAEIDLSQVNLERDAKLMLTSDVLDLFVKDNIAEDYTFTFRQDEKTVIAKRQR